MFSLRNIFIGLLVFFLILASLFAVVSERIAENAIINNVIGERASQVKTTGNIIFNSPNFYAQGGGVLSVPRISAALSKSNETAEETLPKRSGILFYRLININTKQIIASANEEELNLYFTRLPELSMEAGEISINRIQDQIEITYRSESIHALWMGISRAEILSTNSLIGMQLGLLIGLTLIIGAVLYVAGFYFVARPLSKLKIAMENVSHGTFSEKLPKGPGGGFSKVFEKFNLMLESIASVRERNEMVSSLKSDFITTVAHQLRTPLSAVKWSVKIILDQDFGPLNIDQRTILMKGYESNDRSIRLVNDLLDVDRIDSGKLQFEFAPTDLVALIDNIIDLVSPRALERNVSINFTGKEKGIPQVHADATKLRQVVQNLIDNAVKYSYPGGRVLVTIDRAGDKIVTTVTEGGIGIPKDQQQKIFSKFFRADNARKLQADGSGLGLYIMRRIVEKHNGEVSFKSEEGKGTTFTFIIPIDVGKK